MTELFLPWRKDLDLSREPGFRAGSWGWRWCVREACTEGRARAGVPEVVQILVNICIFQME